MQPTRERILNFLGDHPPTSAEELGRYLEMTPANIRYHLDILKDAGLVQVVGTRPTGGAGRTILLYSLTTISLGENLEPLLEGFLSMLKASDPADQLLRDVGQNIIQGKLEEKRNPIERFNQGIEFLNAMHYHANWEARPLGPRIELRHCPYRDLAQAYPILCDLDHNLLQDIFGRQLTVIQLRTRHDEPLTSCIFQAE